MLAPVLDPFDRPAESCGLRPRPRHPPDRTRASGRSRRRHRGSRRGSAFSSQPQHVAEQPARGVRHLGRAPDRQLVLERVRHGDEAAAFHRVRAATMDPQPLVEPVGRLGESLVDIADTQRSSRRRDWTVPLGARSARRAPGPRRSRPRPAAGRSRHRPSPPRPRPDSDRRPARSRSARRHARPRRSASTGRSSCWR